MAWRPSDWVQEGELDNTKPGWTFGWIKLQGRVEPLFLKLAGNCQPDLAGWKFRIIRTDPIPEWVGAKDHADLATDQSGTIGDVTADQMLRHYECSCEEFVRLHCEGNPPPTTLRKSLYLEWFSNRNGRVVIQCTRLMVERLGKRAFELTKEQWLEQAKSNDNEMSFFMHQLADVFDQQPPDELNEPDSAS